MRKTELTAVVLLAAALAWAQGARPSLGVVAHEFSTNEANALHLTEGIFVAKVMPGGPADRAGIQQNDIIVRVDDAPIKNFDDLARILAKHQPGQIVKVAVLRSTTAGPAYEHKTFSVTLGTAPKP